MRLIDADSVITVQTVQSYIYGKIVEEQMTVDEFIKRYTKKGEVPYVDPVRHGEWVNVSKDKSLKLWQCSVCMEKFYNVTFRYCPECGALMDK